MFPFPHTGPFAHVGHTTVAEYHAMIRAGVFDTEEKERCELIEGWIMPKHRQSHGHCFVREELASLFRRVSFPTGWMHSQTVSHVSADSHPEPDGSILREEWMIRPARYPRADEVAVVIEAADTSLEFDQTVKQCVYATAGIPVYWLVNLIDKILEVFTDPVTPPTGAPHYRTSTIYSPGDTVPLVVRGQPVAALAVSDFMP